ncbi:MAG: hypothetical protein GX333_02190 [Syntrophomonadaceae bacterium]|nr:hypothetical protein [Syntrophomonadaceae bacterium]
MSDLLIQGKDFFLTFVLGILAGFVFHYYQFTITRIRVSKYPLYVLDFFIWIVMICLVFLAMLWINQGEMRLYVLIALVLGLFVYYYYFLKPLKAFVETTTNTVLKGVRLLVNSLKKLGGLVKRIFKKLWVFKQKPPPPSDDEG